MTSESLSREMLYHASLSPFKKLLSDGMITGEDYAAIDGILRQKYHPIFADIIPEKLVDIMSNQR